MKKIGALSLLYAGVCFADASSTGSNPANLVDLQNPQIVLSAYDVESNNKFTGSATTFVTPTIAISDTGNTGTKRSYLLPNLFYATPLNKYLFFGFGVTYPTDLSSSIAYADNSVYRYIYTELTFYTLDITPSFGFKVTDNFSVGYGFDFYNLTTTYNAMIPVSVAPGAFIDGKSTNTADSWSFSWHAGILYKLGIATRIGLSHRAPADFHLKGKSEFLFGGSTSQSNNYNLDVQLPAKTSLTIWQGLSPTWLVQGSIDYTQWSCIDQILLKNISFISPVIFNSNKIFDWRNTFTYTLSLNHSLTEQLALGASLGYSQNYIPTGKDFPFIGIGAHYQASKVLGINFSAAHFFIDNYPARSVSTSTVLSGTNAPDIDFVNLQLVWDIN